VFALDDRRVLRRYTNGAIVAGEAELMTYLAAAGFPVPAVYHADGTDLVMERIDGPTVLQALLTGRIDPPGAAGLLADLHHRLHAVPPRIGAAPEDRILHLDLHPANVLLGPAGPVVVDWTNADEGVPDLDVALSAVILAEAVFDQLGGPAEAGTRAFLSAFLRAAGGDPVRVLDQAVVLRGSDPNLTAAETSRLPTVAKIIAATAAAA
jgi:tRNA A-37 threonylcarbamoyl transferase component Bud32